MTRMLAAVARPSTAASATDTRACPRLAGAPRHVAPDPRVDEALRLLMAVGAVLVLLLPDARGSAVSVGWLPMWLLGMPLVALWAIRGFPLRWGGRKPAAPAIRARRRGTTPQARRRARGTGTPVRARAA